MRRKNSASIQRLRSRECAKECGNCGTPLWPHKEWIRPRCVGNVERCHILLSNVTARKWMIIIVQICPSCWQPRYWFGSVLCGSYLSSLPWWHSVGNPQSRVWKLPAFSAWHWSTMQRYSSGVVQEGHKGLWTWSDDTFKYSSHDLRRLKIYNCRPSSYPRLAWQFSMSTRLQTCWQQQCPREQLVPHQCCVTST